LLSLAPPELVEVAAATGYQYVSLRPIPVTPNEPKYPLGQDSALLARTRRKMADTGIKLLDIELARILDGVDIRSYEPALAAAAELGGKFVLSSGWTPDHGYTVEKFAELCELAASYDLTVCFEFVTFASVTDLAGAARVVREANCPNGAICVDTLHFFRSGCRVEELDTLPASWFPYLQVCDALSAHAADREELIFTARADRKFVGEGRLPIADIINRLPEVPYAIEAPNLALSLELSPIDFARRALQSAKAYQDRHPRQPKIVQDVDDSAGARAATSL
jgi:sugar phosphate isomerase/epimerase